MRKLLHAGPLHPTQDCDLVGCVLVNCQRNKRFAEVFVKSLVNQDVRIVTGEVIQKHIAHDGNGDLPVWSYCMRATDFGAPKYIEFQNIATANAVNRIDGFLK